MEFTSEEGEQKYAAVVRAAADTIVGLDFDGTLAPIVEDPAQAHIHPEAGEVLVDLAQQVLAIAVVTGRPARQALDLGGLEQVGNAIGDAGKELYLFGQYGNERWSSTNRRVIGPRPPHGLATFIADLPRLLRRLGVDPPPAPRDCCAGSASTTPTSRRRAWPSPCTPGACRTPMRPTTSCSRPSVSRRAAPPRRRPPRGPPTARPPPPTGGSPPRHDLVVEPGKQVIEVRSDGMNKGIVVDRLVEELDARGFLFIGDDLGDVEAFEAVRALAKDGLATLLVCSADSEESA